MKTIIVPTDYSVTALHAIEYAAQLAKTMKAEIVLLHVFQRPTLISTTLEINSLALLAREHTERLGFLAAQIVKKYGVHVDKIAVCGHLPQILDELVKQKEAGLVIIGMHGLSTVERLLIGSTTATVMENASYPLLVIPEKAAFQPLKRLLFACEYHCLTGRTMLPVLKDMALVSGAEIEVLHIEEPVLVTENVYERVQTGQHLDRFFRGTKHNYAFVEGEDVMESILHRVNSYQADVLALVPREHRIWDILLNRSITHKLIRKVHIPLLILPNIK